MVSKMAVHVAAFGGNGIGAGMISSIEADGCCTVGICFNNKHPVDRGIDVCSAIINTVIAWMIKLMWPGERNGLVNISAGSLLLTDAFSVAGRDFNIKYSEDWSWC